MQSRDSYTPLAKFYIYCTFSTLGISIFNRNIQINGQQVNRLSIIEQVKILAFSYVRNFRSLLRAYSLKYVCFIILFTCSLKFNFESIVLPIRVTDETDFVAISPICNVCEPVFPRIIN